MDDATQKLGTCPTCRHAEHEGHICLNMASDYDCGCDKRPAKVADDATQKLVDRVKDYPTITRLSHKTQIELIEQLRDALEAAQRPPAFFDENGADASPETRELRHRVQAEILGILEKLDATQEREGRDLDVANRLEATGLLFEVFARHAQRPPVSPEVDWSSTDRPHCVQCGERIWAGQMMTVLPSGLREHQDCDLPYRPPVSPEQREAMRALIRSVDLADVQGTFRLDSVESGIITDAILARFSLPVLDVEKVAEAAQAEVNQAHPEWHDVGVGIVQGSHYRAGFVAGPISADTSLHSLTVDGTPSDTERNE